MNIPFKKGTLRHALMDSDWSDLTTDEIAEVLDCKESSVRDAIKHIKLTTGFIVLYTHKPSGRRVKLEE